MSAHESSSRRGFLSIVTGALGAVVGWASSGLAFQRQPRSTAPAPPFRRVVTGFNAAGKSTIASDGPVPSAARFIFSDAELASNPHLRLASGNELWLFNSVPTDLAQLADPLLGALPDGNQPSKGGIIARIVRYEPGLTFPMHTTWSVDLGIVITGSLKLQMEEGSAIVGSGDVVIQRGTPHSWSVVGDQPCVVVFVLVDAVNGHGIRPAA